jgi:hypothetical protein
MAHAPWTQRTVAYCIHGHMVPVCSNTSCTDYTLIPYGTVNHAPIPNLSVQCGAAHPVAAHRRARVYAGGTEHAQRPCQLQHAQPNPSRKRKPRPWRVVCRSLWCCGVLRPVCTPGHEETKHSFQQALHLDGHTVQASFTASFPRSSQASRFCGSAHKRGMSNQMQLGACCLSPASAGVCTSHSVQLNPEAHGAGMDATSSHVLVAGS